MDERTWRLFIGLLMLSAFAITLDAAIPSYDVPGLFWGVPGGIITYLTARNQARIRNGNGNGHVSK